MNSKYTTVVMIWACLLMASCAIISPQQAPVDLSKQIIGPWLRDIPGSHEVDGYYFTEGGTLQLLNIFSMQPNGWKLTKNRLTIKTHTERYPEPQSTDYIVNFISEDILHLEVNGQKTVYHRPWYTTEQTNTRWVPKFIPDASLDTQPEHEPFLQFTTESQLRGFGGCNQFSCTYSLEMNTLTVGPILTTRMYCPNMNYESAFLSALSDSTNYLIVEDQLYLYKEKIMQGAFKAMYYH